MVSHFTESIIDYCHVICGCGSVSFTLNLLLQEFWIKQRAVKIDQVNSQQDCGMLKNCIHCHNLTAKIVEQQLADLLMCLMLFNLHHLHTLAWIIWPTAY